MVKEPDRLARHDGVYKQKHRYVRPTPTESGNLVLAP